MPTNAKLTAEQAARYARHLALPEIGPAGQARLLGARVLLVGVGGLGSSAGYYLAAAGVGTLGLMDADCVEPGNLQRQILHRAADIGRPKVESAADALLALNPAVRLELIRERWTAETPPELPARYDCVVDATDNFPAKTAIADLCHAAARASMHAGVARFYGQAMTVLPGRSACYRCLFDEHPAPEAAGPPAGPLGAVPGLLGCVQAAEVIKYLLGIGALLTNRLLTFDALTMRCRVIAVQPDPQCPLCGR